MTILHKRSLAFIFLTALLFLLFIADVTVGSVYIPFAESFKILTGTDSTSDFSKIIYLFRLPKAITAIFAGSALSICGLMMQSLFRNPLAGPSVLGITSGASIGVALILLGSGFSASNYIIKQIDMDLSIMIVLASSAGAAAIMLIILAVASRIQDNVVLLLVGIMIGNIAISIVSIWQYFAHPEQIQDFLFWTLGSLSGVTGTKLTLISAVVLFVSVVAFLYSNQLNLMLSGRNYASSMGLNYKYSRILVITFTSILAGTVTGFCGPIGFVGIAVPHLARSLFNTSDHKVLAPSCFLIGSCLMLLCDLLAHIPGSQYVLPINAVTALFGSPVVIWVIVKNRNLHSAF